MQNAESDADRGDHYKNKERVIARFSAAKFLEAPPHNCVHVLRRIFPPILWFEKFEIHITFLRFSNLDLTKNLSSTTLADFIIGYKRGTDEPVPLFILYTPHAPLLSYRTNPPAIWIIYNNAAPSYFIWYGEATIFVDDMP